MCLPIVFLSEPKRMCKMSLPCDTATGFEEGERRKHLVSHGTAILVRSSALVFRSTELDATVVESLAWKCGVQ